MTSPERANSLIAQGYVPKYGKFWAPVNGAKPTDIYIELQAFRHNIQGPECPGRFQHFKNIVDVFWNHPESPKKFIWNPWSDKMIEAACKNSYLAVAGSRSSGKSLTFAVWSLVNFFAAPAETKVLVTSTSLKDSRGRIWGDIEELWQAAAQTVGGEANLPGELVSSQGLIRYRSGAMQSDKSGLSLIAGEKSKEKEAVGKLIGFKNTRMILVADELPELSESLIVAAESNLSANPEFQMVALGNPNSYYDPFGQFCEPINGWDSIHEEMDEWQTKRGLCLRFDGEKSPNIVFGENRYPWMFDEAKLEEARRTMGPKSLRYYRMVKAFWCPTGAADSIYTPTDIVRYQADKPAVWGVEAPTPVAGFDPSFTSGGDKSVLCIAKYGVSNTGAKILEFSHFYELNEDRTKSQESRTHQIARQVIDLCIKHNVAPRHLAVDGTGAGKPFCDVLRSMWGGNLLEVNFSGAASELPASSTDRTKSKDRYTNRVSEIWFTGREFMQAGQLRGIKPELAAELCARTYETRERGKVCVESKKDMRSRTGKSPDMADAALLTLALCRQRLGIHSSLKTQFGSGGASPRTFKRFARKLAGMHRFG